MSEPRSPGSSREGTPPAEPAPSLVSLLVEQRQRWQQGERVLVESYLQRHPNLQANADAVLDLIGNELLLRQEAGETPSLTAFVERFPQWAAELNVQFEVERALGVETVNESASPSAVAGFLDPSATAPTPHVPDFEILEVLGKGGMGVVYKARQLSLKRLVALKMIQAGGMAQPQLLARFQQEAEAVARLHHPNIVQIFAIGQHEGCPFLALEFSDGGSLDKALAHQPQPGRTAAHVVAVLARAIHHAHQHQVIHRDLKPSNVLLQLPDGGLQRTSRPPGEQGPFSLLQLAVPKVTDFGLAKQLDSDSGQTQSGAILGTPSYMAPEQAAGDLQRVGPAADVYALGAILYEMLTARPPFRGATPMETVNQVLTRDVTPPSQLVPRLHRDLETICLKALDKDPNRRYDSALALAQDLERFDAGEPILARREGPVRRLWRRVRRRQLTSAAVLAILLALVAGGFFAWEFARALQARTITKELNEGLKAPDWPTEHLEKMETLVAELELLAPEEAASARRNLYRRYADSFIEASRKEELRPDELGRIEKAITEVLAPRDGDLAATVRSEMATKAIEARLPRVELTAAYLDDMEKLISDVRRALPSRAAEARKELYGRYEKQIQHELRLDTTLTAADFDRLKTAIRLLNTYNPDLERSLQKAAERRQGVLQTVRTVQQPFDNAEVALKVKPALKTAHFVLSPIPEKADSPLVVLDEACQGNVQMEGTFAYPSWGTVSQLGLSLYTSRSANLRQSYAFLIGVVPPRMDDGGGQGLKQSNDKGMPATLETARTNGGWIHLQILRNGVTLRQQTVKVALSDKSLTLRATREGNALTFELLQNTALPLSVLRFQDMLATVSATSGTFALYWPHGVGLEALHLRRQSLPPVPGVLEQADHLQAEGDVANALVLYRKVALDSRPHALVRQQARCKEAKCLVQLKRFPEAIDILESLVGELTAEGERWPLVASCELWLLYLRQQRRADADNLADTLLSRGFKHEQLAAVISEEAFEGILSFFSADFRVSSFLLRPSQERLHSLERVVKILDLLLQDPFDCWFVRSQLSHRYRLLGQRDKALQALEKWLREESEPTDVQGRYLAELAWVCRELGQPRRALGPLDHFLRVAPVKHSATYNCVRVERARLNVALGNWQEAEHDLDRYLEAVKTRMDAYQTYADACLMRGFLLQRRQGEDAWKTKYVAADGSGKTHSLTDPAVVFGGRSLGSPGARNIGPGVQGLTLASLTNQLTDEEARLYQEYLIESLPPEYQTAINAVGFRLPPALLREMWRTPRGREAARHMAYQDVPLVVYLKLPAVVAEAAIMRSDGMPALEISREQDELIWQLADDVWEAMRNGTLTQVNMVQMALTWKGTTNFLGWGGLAPALKNRPSLRGPLAYVMGHRLLRLGQPAAKAIELFRTAHGDAPSDSVLSRLAQAELKRLQAK